MRMGFNVRYKRFFIRRIAVIAALLIFIFGIFCRLTPSYSARVAECANAAVNKIVNTAVNDVFSEENGSFSVKNNEILEADTIRLNRLKSQIMTDVQEKLNTYEAQTVQIPLLNASKLPVLSGLGPRIPVKIAPMSVLSGHLEDSFENAGINQVKHSIVLKISVSVNCTGYMFSQTETVITDIPLIETVIKGDVPKYYGTNGGIIDGDL